MDSLLNDEDVGGRLSNELSSEVEAEIKNPNLSILCPKCGSLAREFVGSFASAKECNAKILSCMIDHDLITMIAFFGPLVNVLAALIMFRQDRPVWAILAIGLAAIFGIWARKKYNVQKARYKVLDALLSNASPDMTWELAAAIAAEDRSFNNIGPGRIWKAAKTIFPEIKD
jgi:uncharacterized protein (DUF983 family)